MIAELLNLADLNALTGHEPIRARRIHWFIDLDLGGRVIGFSPTVRQFVTKKGETREMQGKEFSAFSNYHMQWSNGKVQGVCSNDSNWLPDLLSGPAAEIFPAGVTEVAVHKFREIRTAIQSQGKKHRDRQRLHKCRLWRRLVLRATHNNPHNVVLRAVAIFVKQPRDCARLFQFVEPGKREDVAQVLAKTGAGEQVLSFRVNGQIVVWDPEVRRWWEKEVALQRESVKCHLPEGVDAYDQAPAGRLTDYFPSIVGNVALASFNSAPFESYGLGKQTTTMRIETAERGAAAMRFLLETRDNHLLLGDFRAVFWAVPKKVAQSCGVPFVSVLEEHDPCQVRDYLAGAWGVGRDDIDESQFYAVLLHIPSQGRFSVQSWQTDTLRNAKRHMQSYFDAVRLGPDEENVSTIRQLAGATTAKSKKKTVLPAATTVSLFQTALFGAPIPYKLLAQVLVRQQAEMAGGDNKELEFEERLKARTALIRLYFIKNRNKEVLMSTETHEGENHPAYLCGRLLAILDAIHAEAHPKLGKDGKPMRDRRGIAFCASASSPADRMYGAASKTPSIVFPQLCDRVRYHLNKIEAGMAAKLEHGVPSDRRNDGVDQDFDGLAAVVARLKEVAGDSFPRMLSLEDQGRFAIGFYYERCRKWPNFKKEQAGIVVEQPEEN